MGCYLAGPLLAAPYFAACLIAHRIVEQTPLMRAPNSDETGICLIGSLVFGFGVGWLLRELRG